MSYQKRTKDEVAARVAQDIHDGAYVNLGIGQPTAVANHIPKDREVILQSENGILGMGPAPAAGEEDYDLTNAGKQPVSLLAGGSFFHHADSFAMMRGGHLDICVLGAFQVAENGDLANWSTGEAGAIPARRAALQAWRNGRAARWLPGLDYEALFAEPLEDARARLGIRPATVYSKVAPATLHTLKLRAAH